MFICGTTNFHSRRTWNKKLALKTGTDFWLQKLELIYGAGFWSVCHGP